MPDADPIQRLNVALEGRYRVERELGAGGMATVYLAEDVRHHRNVALKVLKPELAAVVGAHRFLTEIETTAKLQHPHILPLFDSGEADGFLFYVMPHVEGESLRRRLDREHQLAVDEAVEIASKVGRALDYAHRHGVIHRDIKPANILLHDGEPVVADFGIALAVSAGGGDRLTETGLSLGTPHYMSPEQATGDQSVGPASDIYALGCVLYEMLVGEPPYTGSSPQAILGKIITDRPVPVTSLREGTPPNVGAAVTRALAKIPADRFRSAEDFADGLVDREFRFAASGEAPTESSGRWKWIAVAGWTVAVAFGAPFTWSLMRPEEGTDPVPMIASLAPFELRSPEGSGERVAISPDGRRIAVSAVVGGMDRIYVRAANSLDFVELEGVEGHHPAFSPDGNALLVEANGLRRVDLISGDVVELGAGGRPHWGLSGAIVHSVSGEGLYVRATEAGSAELVLSGSSIERPHLLPNGRAIVYQSGTDIRNRRLRLFEIGADRPVDLGISGSNPWYAPTGHLLYGDPQQRLMAVPFDAEKMEVAGDPFVVLPEVLVYRGGASQFAVSETGTAIVARSIGGVAGGQLVIVTSEGDETFLPIRGNVRSPRFSPPDGRYIAYEQDLAIHVFDQVTGADRALTSGANAHSPTWSADGTHILYTVSAGGGAIAREPLDGSSPPDVIVDGLDISSRILDVRRDGLLGLAEVPTTTRGLDLLTIDLVEGGIEGDFLRADWSEYGADISPLGTHVAYMSDETGQAEVYVRTFPVPGSPVGVSVDGGMEPVWDPRGEAVYFRDVEANYLMRATVTVSGGRAEASPPDRVLEDRWVPALSLVELRGFIRNWDVHPAGRRFVFVFSPEGTTDVVPDIPLHVITNFFELLEERDPN